MTAVLPSSVAHADHPSLSARTKLTSQRTVGQPIHETYLTNTFTEYASKALPPGPGRSLYLMLEPELGRGRPDILTVTVSKTGLAAYFRKATRLSTFTEAQVISGDSIETIGVSPSYANELKLKIKTTNWHDSQVSHARSLVHDSVGVEAKVSDWRRAIRQIARFGPMVHRTVLLLPDDVADRVDRDTLRVYESGLMTASSQRLTWQFDAPKRPLGDAQKLWLLELLQRHLGDDQTASALRMPSRA